MLVSLFGCLLVCWFLFVGLFDYCLVSLLVDSFVRSFVLSFVRSFVIYLFPCLFVILPVRSFDRSFFLSFARLVVCLFVCLFMYLSFAFVLRDFLVGTATARVIRNIIYEKTGGKGKEVGRQNTKSPRKQQEFRFKRRRPPKARCQLRRPQIPPRRPYSSSEGPRKQESSPKQPKTARMRQKPRNGWKGT